jgi:hypothetical protein
VAHDTDHAIVIAHRPGGGNTFGDISGAKRSSGKHIQKYEGQKGVEVYVYLGFVSQEREKCSNSIYLGKVKLK